MPYVRKILQLTKINGKFKRPCNGVVKILKFQCRKVFEFCCLMSPCNDPRKVPGTAVFVKARAVTDDRHSQRLYGSL